MLVLIARGSTTQACKCGTSSFQVKTGVVYWEGAHREGSRNAQGKLPACLDRHTWSCLREKDLKLDKLSQFVLDECGKLLDKLDLRKDVRQIFVETPTKKQVMMFSATMTSETRGLAKKFISDSPVLFEVD